MVEVRHCRGCGFPVARIAAACPKCKIGSPGYTEHELSVRRWKLLAGFVALLALAAAFARPIGP